MNRLERLFALRGLRPFAQLYDSELATVAEVAVARRFEPGATVVRAGQPVRHLILVTEGALVDDQGQTLPAAFGAAAVLFGTPAPGNVLSHGEQGATCLLIARVHVQTLADEFPAVLLEMQTPLAHASEVGP